MGGDRRRDRAQLMLVGALALAVLLLAIVFLLNTAIFTENLATRADTNVEEITTARSAVVDGVGGLLFYTNYYNNTQYTALQRTLEGDAENWSGAYADQYAVEATGINVSLADVTNGSLLIQESVGELRNRTNATSWELVDGATGVRRFAFEVERTSLASAGTLSDVTGLLGDADVFRTVITNGSATWSVYLTRNSTHIRASVVNATGSDTVVGSCAVDADRAVVDVSGGTVGGESCPALSPFPFVDGPFAVRYESGDDVRAKFVMVTDVRIGTVDDGDLYDRARDEAPYAVSALYAATVEFHFADGTKSYDGRLTVSPEQPPGGERFSVAGVEPRPLVYVADGDRALHSVTPAGKVTEYDATGVYAIGPKKVDFDGDGFTEIPYVAGNELWLVDRNDETRLSTSARQEKSLLGAGSWRGARSVFFVHTNGTSTGNVSSDDVIYRAYANGTTEMVTQAPGGNSSVSAKSVAGIADYNGDGDPDLVYTGDSQDVWYVDDGSTHDTGVNVGQNNGIGVGEPRDFGLDGPSRAPIVDGSQNVGLLSYDGSKRLFDGTKAAKAPVAGINWDGGAPGLEVAFVDTSDGAGHELTYVTSNRQAYLVRNESGDPIVVVDGPGVA